MMDAKEEESLNKIAALAFEIGLAQLFTKHAHLGHELALVGIDTRPYALRTLEILQAKVAELEKFNAKLKGPNDTGDLLSELDPTNEQ